MSTQTKGQHTPGPWECVGGEFSDEPEMAGLVSYFVKLPGGPLISKANADVIAAAPDLLAALEACKARLEFINSDEAAHYSPDDSFWVEMARAAIAKARGEG